MSTHATIQTAALRPGPAAVAAPAAGAVSMTPAAHAAPTSRSAIARENGIDYQLFFLCGHPRSGTNWIGALLNLHPDINCQGEFYFNRLREAFRATAKRPWLAAHDSAARAVLDECFRDTLRRVMLAMIDRKPGATLLGDRTPAPLLGLLENADHILAVRDGRDVVVSWTHHVLRAGGRRFQRHMARDAMREVHAAFKRDPQAFHKNPGLLLSVEPWVRDLSRRWAARVRHDAKVAAAMAGGQCSGRVLTVRYEDLHDNLDAQRRRMYGFLGVDPAKAAPVSQESRTAAGHGRDSPRDFFRKGEVGDWRQYFTPGATRWFKDEAGEALVEAGYERSNDWSPG